MKRLLWTCFFACLLAVTPALAIPTQDPPQTIPPTDVATGAATPSETSAEVLGYFNYGSTYPPGIPKECWFDYGTTTAYGSRTTAICSGTTKATLTPLVPGTTYHYRAAASNEAGTTNGPDKTFTTLGTPPPDGTAPPADNPPTLLRVVSGQSLGSVLRSGLRLRLTLAGPCPCAVRGKLLVSRATARRLGLEHLRSIASTRRNYSSAGTATIRLKLKSSLKRKLRHTRVLRASARATVTGTPGQPTVVSRSLRLKRKR
jgi:hypothetical protein